MASWRSRSEADVTHPVCLMTTQFFFSPRFVFRDVCLSAPRRNGEDALNLDGRFMVRFSADQKLAFGFHEVIEAKIDPVLLAGA